MLTPTTLQAYFKDFDDILNFKVDGQEIIDANEGDAKDKAKKYAGEWTYNGRGGTNKACFSFGDDCAFHNILHVFGFNAETIAGLTDASIRNALKTWAAAPTNSFVPTLNAYKSFELEQVLGGIGRDSNGDVTSAELLSTTMFLKFEEEEVAYYKDGRVRVQDPIVMNWEADVSCYCGFEEEHPIEAKNMECKPASGLTYNGLLTRSLSDEFGDAIRNDVAMIGVAYGLIIVYLVFNLGKRDKVHSMIALSCGSLICVGAAYAASQSIGAFLQVKINPLNGNIPFLLLGLGVDDSFVIVAEFLRHTRMSPDLSVEELGARTARTAGMSVLVTSLTDGLAFLVGSSTSLPALSSFCLYAGLGVFACFTYMFTLFLPLVVVNAKRAAANRFDCLCCFKSKVEHNIEEPQGCCSCFPPCVKIQPADGLLARMMGQFGNIVVKTMGGKVASLIVFVALLVAGVTGATQFKKEFKLEWFFPPDSYALDYFELNDKYFSTGQKYTVYAQGVDFYGEKNQLNELVEYIEIQSFTVDGAVNDNWYGEFLKSGLAYADEASFWDSLWTWFQGPGARYQGAVKWQAGSCNEGACTSAQKQQGIQHAKLFSSTLKKMESGNERYEVYRTIREDMRELFNDSSGKKVFPYSMQFLYWEENGVIDAELFKNLIIAFAVICAIIALLIPHPRIAVCVALMIMIAVVEVMGFAHYWGVTMNGVSTIYFLICAGLAVDYSAHIAHVFKDSYGNSMDRAAETLQRIGPSVFHAIFSTILAVCVLSFSKSFVFVVFFKVLFLVCVIAGAHGIWFLPVVLGILGGDVAEPTEVQTWDSAKEWEPAKAMEEAVTGDKLSQPIGASTREVVLSDEAAGN
jgi:predicted RND superfamily exporter protein